MATATLLDYILVLFKLLFSASSSSETLLPFIFYAFTIYRYLEDRDKRIDEINEA